MHVELDESRPIWVQLVDEFRRRIAVGEWAPGSKIPSVRELALDFGVNPNTAQRALSETDRLELTVSVRTSGRYVTDQPSIIAQARTDLAEETIDHFIATVSGIGMDLHETTEALGTRWPLVTDTGKDAS